MAQLGFGRRVIGVGGQDIQIAGVGAVCVDPDWQGQGVGKRLLRELHHVLTHQVPADFGFLQYREAVTGFYERGGFVRASARQISRSRRATVGAECRTDNGPSGADTDSD